MIDNDTFFKDYMAALVITWHELLNDRSDVSPILTYIPYPSAIDSIIYIVLFHGSLNRASFNCNASLFHLPWNHAIVMDDGLVVSKDMVRTTETKLYSGGKYSMDRWSIM